MQYIQPQHHARLAQAELLVIDEAAAIPLPLVRAMLGPYLVFLCSTVNGYEGAPARPLEPSSWVQVPLAVNEMPRTPKEAPFSAWALSRWMVS